MNITLIESHKVSVPHVFELHDVKLVEGDGWTKTITFEDGSIEKYYAIEGVFNSKDVAICEEPDEDIDFKVYKID